MLTMTVYRSKYYSPLFQNRALAPLQIPAYLCEGPIYLLLCWEIKTLWEVNLSHQRTSIHGLSKKRVPPTNNNPGGVLFAIILIWFEHGTGHPGDQPFSREWGAESTPLENNPPYMEDTDIPSWYMSYSSIQNKIFIWRFGVWHIPIYLERQVDTVYR